MASEAPIDPAPDSAVAAIVTPPQRADEIFLEGPNSRFAEFCTLLRVMGDFLRGYRALHFVGPCVTVFGSARIKPDDPHYELARKMGATIARLGFTVMTGGGPGIMEAANHGARDSSGKTIGLNIGLPFEQLPNPYISPELSFEFHYFFMRKFWFAYLAKALVIFPGGFGTMDELFEILTLAQTQKLAKKILVVIYGREYWDRLINFQTMVDAGAISPPDLELFKLVDTPEEGFEFLREGLTRYHLGAERPRRVGEVVPEIAKTNP
jgi:uncharacterized protein (TIGR00730 family)